MTIGEVARVCHEANKAYCEMIGDFSQQPWAAAPEWQKRSAIEGVVFHLANPGSKPQDSHVSWMEKKRKDGWVYGAEKNEELKTHPCMLPYDELPEDQKVKDFIFTGIVHALAPFVLGV